MYGGRSVGRCWIHRWRCATRAALPTTTSDLVYAHVRGETSRVEYNPNHRWYYFSEQQTDEVLFIRVHDSADDGWARLSFHTSFENPLTPGAPPRESIEVRTLVFFPPSN